MGKYSAKKKKKDQMGNDNKRETIITGKKTTFK